MANPLVIRMTSISLRLMGTLRSENAISVLHFGDLKQFCAYFQVGSSHCFQVNSHTDLIFLCEKFDHSAQIGEAVDVTDRQYTAAFQVRDNLSSSIALGLTDEKDIAVTRLAPSTDTLDS